jgi:hypothetical protein
MLSITNQTMSISRLCFCTCFKLVCSTYYHPNHHSRFPGYDHYHQFSHGYVSKFLTLPKSISSN